MREPLLKTHYGGVTLHVGFNGLDTPVFMAVAVLSLYKPHVTQGLRWR